MKKKSKDYYSILGVTETAQPEDIKKKFRELALQYHPDKNPGNSPCEERFKEITEAYGVLIDPKKRKKYDLFRSAGFGANAEEASDFKYSQRDIFEDIFNNPRYRSIFEELNRDFSQSGFRSGPNFFQNTFFGSSGGIWKLLWLLPGPLGRIGNFLRLIQVIGSSLFFIASLITRNKKPAGGNVTNPILESLWKLSGKYPKKEKITSADIALKIIIPSQEAASGAQKEITYKANEIPERLIIRIPPGIRSGQTLRLKEKGNRQSGKRGDLFLSVQLEN